MTTTAKPDTTRFRGQCAGCGEVIEFEWDWSDGVIDVGVTNLTDGLMYTTVKHGDGSLPECSKLWSTVYEVRPD